MEQLWCQFSTSGWLPYLLRSVDNNSGQNNPSKARICQPIAGFTSRCPQTKVNYHLAGLGLRSCQHVESYSLRLLSRAELSLRINNYSNSSLFWVCTDSIKWSASGIKSVPLPSYEFKAGHLKLRDLEACSLVH